MKEIWWVPLLASSWKSWLSDYYMFVLKKGAHVLCSSTAHAPKCVTILWRHLGGCCVPDPALSYSHSWPAGTALQAEVTTGAQAYKAPTLTDVSWMYFSLWYACFFIISMWVIVLLVLNKLPYSAHSEASVFSLFFACTGGSFHSPQQG